MSHDAHPNPQPGGRREAQERADRSGQRRPLTRARAWTRERFGHAHIKTPSRKAMTWTGAVLGLLVIAVAILIAVWDWNWFRGPLARVASARMHREVTISGDLKVHPFSWRPSATVDGVHIANPHWASSKAVGQDRMADIGRISVQIRLLPLLGGHLDLPLLRFDQPHVALLRDAQGRSSWDFSDGKNPGQPMKLPPIRDFIIDGGHVIYRDVDKKLNFTGTLNASEEFGAQNRGFEMRGQGTLNAQPFTLLVTGGPLLNIDRAKPYPFDANIRAGETYVTARGEVPRPFDLGHFYMNSTARGPDLADLYGITGVALPNTPPYNLRGRLSRDGQTWRIDGISGRVGSSDLAGRLEMVDRRPRPLLTADLHSKSLDFADTAPLFGGGPKVGKVASPTQVATAQIMQRQQRLLPDATLKVDRIRGLDADVTYKAASIHNSPVNLQSGSAHVKLNAGVLTADPLAFELPQGRIAGSARLDARKDVPRTDLDLRLTNARLETLLPLHLGGGQPFAGSLVGRVKLHGAGDSVHKAFSSANGEVMAVVPSGEIRRAFAELMGVDVVKGLGLLLSKDQETTPIRCGVAHFRAVDGVFRADRIVFDTGPVLVTGSGSITMGDEKLDLRAQGHPKKFQLVRVLAPVTAQGSLLHPKLGVQPGPALAQGGAAAALGAFLSPLAAILPFIDPGLAKDANCVGLVAEAGHQGAPVKTAARG
ncbi:MAG TPA: AsmA family protein [Phenylobacterium sp.]|uniref:AsmA family protein n=1 Tax=Phenylobacterium sp. TaxID=1871053 RepID=UPI002B461C25|nr:AsmA family protein [Phenylobacterium sp.]HKR87511.1 AsmA family protein [Phenylobacterium sp.]